MEYILKELRSYMIDENCGVYQMLQEIPATDEFNQCNEFYGLSKQEVKQKIDKLMKHAYGFDNCEDFPKCEHFILFANDKPVVVGALMLEMTEFWKKHRGHIWYKTRPSERNKGYCNIFVKMLCERAQIFGYKELLAQCNVNNIASNKVLLQNNFKQYKNPLCPNSISTIFYKKTL